MSSIKGRKRVERSNLCMGISEDSKQQNEQRVTHFTYLASEERVMNKRVNVAFSVLKFWSLSIMSCSREKRYQVLPVYLHSEVGESGNEASVHLSAPWPHSQAASPPSTIQYWIANSKQLITGQWEGLET